MPPAEGKGPALDVGAAAHLPKPPVVGGDVLEEVAPQTQWLQEAADVVLQAAFATHHWTEGLGDAQVLGQDEHGDLWGDTGGFRGAQQPPQLISQRKAVGDPPKIELRLLLSVASLPSGNPALFPLCFFFFIFKPCHFTTLKGFHLKAVQVNPTMSNVQQRHSYSQPLLLTNLSQPAEPGWRYFPFLGRKTLCFFGHP